MDVFSYLAAPFHPPTWTDGNMTNGPLDRCRHLSTGKTWATIFRSDSFSKGRERRDERTGLARGGWRERKGTNRYHFGVIGTGRGINVLTLSSFCTVFMMIIVSISTILPRPPHRKHYYYAIYIITDIHLESLSIIARKEGKGNSVLSL